jgi:hypothetical protein
MALLVCPDCQAQVSSRASACLGCGRPVATMAAASQLPERERPGQPAAILSGNFERRGASADVASSPGETAPEQPLAFPRNTPRSQAQPDQPVYPTTTPTVLASLSMVAWLSPLVGLVLGCCGIWWSQKLLLASGGRRGRVPLLFSALAIALALCNALLGVYQRMQVHGHH